MIGVAEGEDVLLGVRWPRSRNGGRDFPHRVQGALRERGLGGGVGRELGIPAAVSQGCGEGGRAWEDADKPSNVLRLSGKEHDNSLSSLDQLLQHCISIIACHLSVSIIE